MKDYKVGVTAPPFHVRCRSTTVPHLDEEIWGVGERAARGEDGKTYYVPDNITYPEWREKFVNGGEKSGVNEVDKSENGDIINAKKVEMAGTDVHYVGKIDVEKYKCISNDIITDEVIITETQIAHIKERHPNDYEKFGKYFADIVSNPDYIIEANKPNTALILKEIQENQNEKFKTVLRIVTSTDNPEYKNSIITFMKIDEKEWNRILKNKKYFTNRNKYDIMSVR